jgi:hypothetical protein
MACAECHSLERLFLESMVFADEAETSLRAFFLTHQHSASVSELDEYHSLAKLEHGKAEERNRAYLNLVSHWTLH